MKTHSLLKRAAIAILIIMAAGCQQEPLQIQNGDKVECWGCEDLGGGGIGQPPVVSSFSPQQGIVGTKVGINGSRFSATPSNNIVRFNGVQASVISATTVRLVVSVPQGAVSGKISVNVSGLQGLSATDFTVIVPPLAIDSFSPQRGIIGTSVTINGTGFSVTPSANVVTFDGVQATVISATTTALVVLVPSGATSGKLNVTVGASQVIGSTDFQIIDIPLNGLVAFYPFDGNAKDISSNQLHGTVNGAVLSADRSGNMNSAYLFDGDDDINMGNPIPLQIANTMTVSVWIKLSSDNFGMQNIITKLDATYQPTQGFCFRKNPTPDGVINAGLYTIRPLGLGCQNYFTGNFQVSNWIFLSYSVSGTNMRFYINGILARVSTNQCPLTDGSLGNFIVGDGMGAYYPFDGNIDDVTVYNRALSDEEVMSLYQQNILQ